MTESNRPSERLALLADPDRETGRLTRPWLAAHGLGLVHAQAGVAALELLQRLPDSFELVLVSLDLPDLHGAVLIETLRLFRPTISVVCLTSPGEELDFDVDVCLSKPINQMEFNSEVANALGTAGSSTIVAEFAPEAIARAKARYAVSGNLLDAAREIARGFTGGEGGDF